jgi:hypothetical protein
MKLVIKASYLIIALAIIISLYFLYLLYWPVHLPDFKTPFKIIKQEVETGTAMQYQIDYCKYKNYPVELHRYLVNDTVVLLVGSTMTGVDLGCHVRDFALEIPKGIPSGFYKLDLEYHYKINPFREKIIKIESEQFQVFNPVIE